jgi:hypothetical protein
MRRVTLSGTARADSVRRRSAADTVSDALATEIRQPLHDCRYRRIQSSRFAGISEACAGMGIIEASRGPGDLVAPYPAWQLTRLAHDTGACDISASKASSWNVSSRMVLVSPAIVSKTALPIVNCRDIAPLPIRQRSIQPMQIDLCRQANALSGFQCRAVSSGSACGAQRRSTQAAAYYDQYSLYRRKMRTNPRYNG